MENKDKLKCCVCDNDAIMSAIFTDIDMQFDFDNPRPLCRHCRDVINTTCVDYIPVWHTIGASR